MEHPDLAEGFILESPFVAPSESAIGWHKTLGEDLKIHRAIKMSSCGQILKESPL